MWKKVIKFGMNPHRGTRTGDDALTAGEQLSNYKYFKLAVPCITIQY